MKQSIRNERKRELQKHLKLYWSGVKIIKYITCNNIYIKCSHSEQTTSKGKLLSGTFCRECNPTSFNQIDDKIYIKRYNKKHPTIIIKKLKKDVYLFKCSLHAIQWKRNRGTIKEKKNACYLCNPHATSLIRNKNKLFDSWANKNSVFNINGCQIVSDEFINKRGYPEYLGKHATRFVLARKLGRRVKRTHYACHTCDNPKCINPEHLWEGTAKQNSQDAVNKKRIAWGERQGSHVLKKPEAIYLALVGELARRTSTSYKTYDLKGLSKVFYFVHRDTIRKCLTGDYWKHLKVREKLPYYSNNKIVTLIAKYEERL